ncbi:gene transfer agent family protein [Brucella anthropi]|uniref:gene transfer agent family protein n=1 Tax=Brucella anthropi TaxID=529 RepID=UPI0005BCB21E|nr:gene transfer agent family protein [Brucella anthropi]KIU68511.1 hypothetical protein TR92_11725 [Brucella anthropi]
MTEHRAFFGDGEKTFALAKEQINELERKAGFGIGALYQQFVTMQFRFGDALEVLRLGLIGGGTSPVRASELIEAYAKPTPIVEIYGLAFDILETRWSGQPASAEISQDETGQDVAE